MELTFFHIHNFQIFCQVTALLDAWLFAPPPNAGAANDLFDWFMRNVKAVMPANDSIIISQILNLMSAILAPYVKNNEVLPVAGYRKLFAFCVAWGFAGLCEPEERQKFHDKLQEVKIFRKYRKKDVARPCSYAL